MTTPRRDGGAPGSPEESSPARELVDPSRDELPTGEPKRSAGDVVLDVLRAIREFLWGKSHFRFGYGLVVVGAGLVAPPRWQIAFVELLLTIAYILLPGEAPQIGPFEREAIVLALGVFLCLSGVVTYVWFEIDDRRSRDGGGDPDRARINAEWVTLKSEWKLLNDLHPDPVWVQPQDLYKAVVAVTSAARFLTRHPEFEDEFTEDCGEDYSTLFVKLRDNRYTLGEERESVRAMLTDEASSLAARLEERAEGGEG